MLKYNFSFTERLFSAIREYQNSNQTDSQKVLFWEKIQHIKAIVIQEYETKMQMRYQDAFQNFVNGDYVNAPEFKNFVSRIERINKVKREFFRREAK